MKKKVWSLIFHQARIDAAVLIEKGEVIGFSVNLSLLEDEKRYDVIRWDTSHGYLHKHLFWKTKRTIKTKKYKGMPLDVVFKEVYEDLKKNYKKYIRKWKNEKKKRKNT